MANVIDPGGILAGEEATFGGEEATRTGPHARTQSLWATADSARWIA